ncbi:MAG: hypothetical protein HHJ11_17540 [Phycicoccus sp.]|nr:hypothetical protein [Phycicoccus sp.]NMM35327.1 hypothetical protein [Phycicoccus sp.]
MRGTKDTPPAGFVDFVVSRGPALHRTAVLLTGQERAAEDLVQIALAKAWPSWTRIDANPEAYVRRIMINEFASDSPRRQRAAVVLRFFHNYSEAATAEAMGTRVSTVKSQTFDAPANLPDTLREEADAAAHPDVDALMAGARRHLASTRRRRRSALGVTTVAVLLVGGLIATTSSVRQPTRPPSTQPVSPRLGSPQLPDPGPFTVNAGGGGFPEYSQGMKRVTVLDSPMLERATGSIIIPTTPGRHLAVRMSCTPTGNVENTLEWENRMLARFTGPDGTSQATCSGTAGGNDQIGIAVAAKTTVLANVFVSHEPSPNLPSLFKNAQIHVAIYESVPWEDYPVPPRPADLDTNPEYAWWSGPGEVQVQGPKTPQEANKPLTFTQPFARELVLNLQVRGPGRLRVLINGKDIGRQLDDWMLTEGTFISFWDYRSTGFTHPLDPAFTVDPAGATDVTTPPGSPVTVTIIPRDFQGPDWQITVGPDPGNVG